MPLARIPSLATLALAASLACSPSEPPPALEGPAQAAAAARPAPPPRPAEAPAPAPAERAGEPTAAAPRVYYRYLDAAGSLRIVESLSAVPRAERSRAKRIVIDAPRTAGAGEPAERAPKASPFARLAASGEGQAPAAAADVVIYTAKWCGWCQQALQHLDRRGVSYHNRDIDIDPDAPRDLRRLTGSTSVPVLEIGGSLVRGFDVARIDALLDGRP